MKYIIISFYFLILSCSHINQNDPLKNTKKLVHDGHRSLYENGAFQIPSTKIKLIPEGPAPISLALELSGASARSSFLSALCEAKDSVKIVVEGSKKSYAVAGNAWHVATLMSEKISAESRTGGVWVIENSSDLSQKIFGKTDELSPALKKEMLSYSQSLSDNGIVVGDRVAKAIDRDSSEFKNNFIQKTHKTSSSLKTEAQEIWDEGQKSFIYGYMALPKTISKHSSELNQAISFKNYTDQFEKSENMRSEWSKDMSLIFSGTLQDYSLKTRDSLSKAKNEFVDSTDTIGLTFASLKAAGWVLHGLLWKGGIKPIGKLSMAGLGYIFINGLAYPAVVTTSVGIETGNILVEVTKGVGLSAIEVVAPTGRAAVSAIMSGAVWSTGHATDIVGQGAAHLARGASLVAAPVLKYSIQGASVGSAKTIEYIGVPLVQAGIYTSGALTGVMARGSGFVAGKTVDWGGQAVSGATTLVGGTTAATIALVGTAGSVGLGALDGLYQVGKATAVPSAQILGGAIVLSYGTLAQLSAHTLLAASDSAYLVLSMEGPSFVIYSIKGLVSKGDKIPTNAVLNLEELRQQGEIIEKIPVTDDELQKILQQTEKEYGE